MYLQFFKLLCYDFYMFRKSANIIIGLTTRYNEYLGLSIPALARIKRKIILIIHNDNPETKISKRQIRKLGYRGRLHIINSNSNIGKLRSRLAILDFVAKKKLKSKWFVFTNDDDVLLDIKIPSVSDDIFAVIQNIVVIKKQLNNVLRIMKSPTDYVIDNENVCMLRPSIGMKGTAVRLPLALDMGHILNDNIADFLCIDEQPGAGVPVDTLMWSVLNIIAHSKKSETMPIYMDSVSCITMKLGQNPKDSKPNKAQAELEKRLISKCNQIIYAALGINTGAAPAGQ